MNCPNCRKIFSKKYLLNRHMNKKKRCNTNIAILGSDNLTYKNGELTGKDNIFQQEYVKSYLDQNTCAYCKKRFTRKNNTLRHINNYCKTKKKYEKEELLHKLKELEEENIYLKNKSTSINNSNINININSNNNNNNTNNIILVNYGKEDISKIDLKEIIRVLHAGFYSSVQLTKLIHFNPKYPENHNIYISNMKNRYGMKYENNKWNLVHKDDLINEIYEDKKDYIETNLSKFCNFLSEHNQNTLGRWLITQNDDIVINNIKNDIKLLLYNNRGIIKNGKSIT